MTQNTKIITFRHGKEFLNLLLMTYNKIILGCLIDKSVKSTMYIRRYLKLTTYRFLLELTKYFLILAFGNLILITYDNEVTITLLHKEVQISQQLLHGNITTFQIIKNEQFFRICQTVI